MVQGVKDFIVRGNAVEMAVGIVIGAAFGGVVEAITDKVLNPLVGAIFGRPDLDRLVVIPTSSGEILPGAVLTALLNFLLVAGAVYFLIVAPINALAARREAAEAVAEADEVSEEAALLTEIRDLLAQNAAD